MKQIKGYPDYFITENGEVYSKKYGELRKMKPQKHKDAYHQVGLSKDNYVKYFLVHRLVALTYIPNPNNYREIDHIDGDKSNNHVSNLEWVTRLENMKRAHESDLINKKGEKHHNVKLTDEQVKWIRDNYIPKHPEFGGVPLSIKFNVKKACISHIVNNKRWKHI